jgi:hypothetical protein
MLGAIISGLLSILGAVFAAMMALPAGAAGANLKTYWALTGLSVHAGIYVGVALAIVGLVVAVIRWRISYSVGPIAIPLQMVPTPGPERGRAMFELNGVSNSVIENCHTDRSETLLRASNGENLGVYNSTVRTPPAPDKPPEDKK